MKLSLNWLKDYIEIEMPIDGCHEQRARLVAHAAHVDVGPTGQKMSHGLGLALARLAPQNQAKDQVGEAEGEEARPIDEQDEGRANPEGRDSDEVGKSPADTKDPSSPRAIEASSEAIAEAHYRFHLSIG